MNCVVTAGPTYEPLDEVRRLTNFSTGRLGSELAGFLASRGHTVTLLLGEQATYRASCRAQRVVPFTTTASLSQHFQALAGQSVDAIFHAAAVSDFRFGTLWFRSPSGDLTEVKAGKVSTRQGPLLVELLPTPKILASLRTWFPHARLFGWKYEVDGDRAGVLALAGKQLTECLTDACIANGPAYGDGFGLLKRGGDLLHLPNTAALYAALEQAIRE